MSLLPSAPHRVQVFEAAVCIFLHSPCGGIVAPLSFREWALGVKQHAWQHLDHVSKTVSRLAHLSEGATPLKQSRPWIMIKAADRLRQV